MLKSVPLALVIWLPLPAENVPLTVSSETPVVVLLVLLRLVNWRSIVALVMSTAGPLVASKMATPAGTVTWVPVPAPTLTAPVPVTRSAAPLSAKMSRSVKARSPETLVSSIPAPPTPLPAPAAPTTVVPPLTCW